MGKVEQWLQKHKLLGAEYRSGEELESVRPVDDMTARSSIYGVYPLSNLPLDTPHRETVRAV